MSVRSNSPYTPSYIYRSLAESKPTQLSYSQIQSDSLETNEQSFRYDPLDQPLKSTQQIKLDWSKFENHTFFSSAEVKVNEAFNKLINSYPFDGTKTESQQFMDSLTGFEKYVFDQFPKWSGCLQFSGTQVGESGGAGTWIEVKDRTGYLYPDIAKNKKGDAILGPKQDDSLSIELLLKLPEITNGDQVILQKVSGSSMGFTLHLEQSTSTQYVSGVFSISSGSIKNRVSTVLEKGVYNHLCAILNKEGDSADKLQFFVNESLAAESEFEKSIGEMDIKYSSLLIGSGTSFYSANNLVTPSQTLSGTMDELRVFHSVRSVSSQNLFATRGIYSTPDLKLYYRFNEPSGSLSLDGNTSIDSIVLDSSGNSLHSNIQNFDASLRIDASQNNDGIMANEINEFKIVLFPAYQSVIDLNLSLLETAKDYDRNNPNNIAKLIPQHYLLEGASQEGFENIEGTIMNPYTGEGIPGQGSRGSAQAILSFLYIWSKFFDELKIYIDSFGTLQTIKYENETDTVPDNFLEDVVRSSGFYLPRFFTNASVEQYSEGKYIEGLTDGTTTLKQLQATLTRRALVNLHDIMNSKGTQHSIRSFLRSIGIDPDNSLRIREYGGPTTRQLVTSRDKRFESGAMVKFSSSSFIISTPLSSSRVEPGYPLPAGSFVFEPNTNEIIGTTDPNDGLLTSGSWNLECLFKFPPQSLENIVDGNGYQSLFRLITTGSSISSEPALIANVIATQFIEHPETPATVKAFVRPGTDTSAPTLSLELDLKGKGIFDGEKWNVAIGCQRNDEINSNISSSYYLRAAKADSGDIVEFYTTSSYFQENEVGDNVFRQLSPNYNASGSYICVGPAQTINTTLPSDNRFLNDYALDDVVRTVDYAGWASNLKFWSKSMSVDEWKEHARNPKSVGVDDPYKNYNFVTELSGSFEKLRLETLIKQPTRSADLLGEIKFLDFSLNFGEAATGSGFDPDSKVLVGDIFAYSYISPAFDEATTNDKIRIKSFEDSQLLAENPTAVPVPSYSSNLLMSSEEVQDDLRLSIEFSMTDSLDKDIINMFSSLDVFNDALGRPELAFSPDYPNLTNLQDVYFNRLSGKPDYRSFLEFYRWFDISISTFIEQLVPSKTIYKGTNYVVESHILERHKNIYRHSDNYLTQKNVIQDSLLVQQIVGRIRKY
jgi:Concanavalin A-like lectin/glucanases superfamily